MVRSAVFKRDVNNINLTNDLKTFRISSWKEREWHSKARLCQPASNEEHVNDDPYRIAK